ncbi:MAG: hypothetical protein AUK47_20950 [Deltaproteobacteria bacterium CG2_30_63_29]|nr:MAG: hypothetical protein AUK47_20950 [Deltaproteobacteria bacterium CG2_30_63_29]PIV99297.1 MAG: hypothetical protein COW42_11470 [Deltaproteobacteria bacterium CG17_big_fil_post_rev_8_21_14_2_50_63_7]PJB37569.1 MAG: hypothetical protein CO108_20865 [Deltaproteobacteria bacterium CG_4_9_14_3_um_filter_63_12]
MTPEETVAAWLALLNRDTDEPTALADDVVLHFYPDGSGGRRDERVGVDQTMTWIQRPPKGNYRFSADQIHAGPPAETLAPAELATHARFKVELTIAKWSNTGSWILHSSGPKITAVHHEPDKLPDDSAVEAFPEKKEG